MSAKMAERKALEQAYTESLNNLMEARESMNAAKQAIIDFDQQNPSVMREANRDANRRKAAVSAHGAASLPSVKAEGG